MRKKLAVSLCLLLMTGVVRAQLRIWEGTDEHARRVTLTPYLPEQVQNAPAVIVCPGGSYCWLDRHSEGTMVAEWLREQGIAAFVLRYRTSQVIPFMFHTRLLFRGNQYPDPLKDIQRAVQLIREHAGEYHVDPHCVGAMGFSAGGHLVLLSANAQTDFLNEVGIPHEVSVRPDFVAALYPVVTLSESCTHARSRRGLLGEWRKHKASMRDSLSVERHISDDCPPVFLANCEDDPVVNFQNSVLLDSALTAKRINHVYFRYKSGGHGFGANPQKGTEECRQWKSAFMEWFKKLFDHGA